MLKKKFQKDLVLLGGGHSNILLLKDLVSNPLPDYRITLISNHYNSPYSGMLPGYLTGFFDYDDIHIDLNIFCSYHGIRMIRGKAAGLDPVTQQVFLEDRPSLRYDILSINTGSEQSNTDIEIDEDNCIPVKPIEVFLDNLEEMIERIRSYRGVFHLMMVGNGPSAVEMAIAVRTKINKAMAEINLIPDTVKLFLCIPGETILPGLDQKAAAIAMKGLRKKKIHILTHSRVLKIQADKIHMQDQKVMPADAVIMCTGARPQKWLEGPRPSVDTELGR